jgi:hypothetical protein
MVAWQQAGIAARQERAGHQAQHAHERGLGARLVAGKQRYHHARRCPEDRAHVDIAIAMLEQGRAVAQRIEEIALDVHVDIAVERRVIDEQRGHALSLVSRLEQAIAKVHAFARSMDAADAERGVKARGGKGLALHHQPRFPQVVEHVVEIIDHVLRDRCGRLHIAFGADVAGDEIQPAFLHHPGGAPELVGLDRIDIVVIERDQAVARVVGADVAGVGRAAKVGDHRGHAIKAREQRRIEALPDQHDFEIDFLLGLQLADDFGKALLAARAFDGADHDRDRDPVAGCCLHRRKNFSGHANPRLTESISIRDVRSRGSRQ